MVFHGNYHTVPYRLVLMINLPFIHLLIYQPPPPLLFSLLFLYSLLCSFSFSLFDRVQTAIDHSHSFQSDQRFNLFLCLLGPFDEVVGECFVVDPSSNQTSCPLFSSRKNHYGIYKERQSMTFPDLLAQVCSCLATNPNCTASWTINPSKILSDSSSG